MVNPEGTFGGRRAIVWGNTDLGGRGKHGLLGGGEAEGGLGYS